MLSKPSSVADVFTENEIILLDHIAGRAKSSRKRTLAHYVTVAAKLGGYLAPAAASATKALPGLF